MQGSKKIPIIDLNQHITCKICNGYFVDATTIIECLHTFCRSCIVKYLENHKYCPVCDVQVHKTKPLLNVRPDKTLQDIVYKLVPRLFQNEMQRRREFYDKHPEVKPSNLEQCEEASYQHLLTPEETVCLTLSYHGYLRCPAAVSVNHLKKLIRAKYDLTTNHKVEILYNQDCLTASLTLMDVAYIYMWKRKGPIELTYKIYECTAKKPRLEAPVEAPNAAHNNNNNWKEVQLRISENGEMSITGIQDSALSPSLLEIVNADHKYKNDNVAAAETKPAGKETTANATKKELPGLKYIGKCTSAATLTAVSPPITSTAVDLKVPVLLTSCATLSSGTTTTVFSTINSSKCSTMSDDTPIKVGVKPDNGVKEVDPLANNLDKNLKRRCEEAPEVEPPIKQPKPTILNHSLSLLNLSNNHPLKRHSKKNRNGENIKDASKASVETEITLVCASSPSRTSIRTTNDVTFPKPTFVNKNFVNVPSSRPGTPVSASRPPISSTRPSIAPPKPPAAYAGSKSPCYMPKTTYNPVLNVPKPTASMGGSAKPEKTANIAKAETKPPATSASLPVPKTSSPATITKACTVTSPQQTLALNNKMAVKVKPSTPIGYKTLRDPPKSWNSQISKANLNKAAPDPKFSDLKNVRPAKFFKMRNNMPRYLGNPASGVKPMYQLHVSPDKEKHHHQETTGKMEKSEIRKHSIVKIDPKTLKPISEKAPETTSLSNHGSGSQSLQNHGHGNHAGQNYGVQALPSPSQSDLKINTSSVSIFNPLKLQSSPKNDRRSPKSPHSPKIRSQAAGSPTGGKRDKVNLNFTPPNPFIPNLTSPTMSPNQFLYPTGPPGFPPYDPRMMAAYHSLWYGQRMGFSASPIPGLSLDLNQRKNFEMMPSPTSPKMGGMSQQGHSPQSLETTVEKLTQNRTKEISIRKAEKAECKGKNSERVTEKTSEAVETGREKKENPVQKAEPPVALPPTNAEPTTSVAATSSSPASVAVPNSTSPLPVTSSPPVSSPSSLAAVGTEKANANCLNGAKPSENSTPSQASADPDDGAKVEKSPCIKEDGNADETADIKDISNDSNNKVNASEGDSK
ncbi:hypothetical protein NQ317_004608 [Molorchus minor]|uniref:RING-type domain-containing protein n=1 Tax=Molorchus minor TaxID=1323400 RepID=A0ABQ9J5T9_9CUCU|nr:hypothetical protein NQ317_004608 [Molorchus minor]